MKSIYIALALLLMTAGAFAQDSENASASGKKADSGKGYSIMINGKGVHVGDNQKKKKEDAFEIQYGVLDLGVNTLHDKTNYQLPTAQQLVKTDGPNDASAFSLRNSKSINVNIYPVVAKYRFLNTRGQKLYASIGAGLQLYNFRFTKPITYLSTPSTAIVTDSVSFRKNKLAFTYLSVPLMITAKTRITPKGWLVYGAGITAGYRLSSWTKQISNERGKEKNFDSFNFNDFNTCVTAEIGVDEVFRIYASYQLNPLAKYGLDQHPVCIGIRLFGI